MPISDRLDQIEARAETVVGLTLGDDNARDAYNLVEDAVPDLVAAVRAVLDACDRIDASIIPSGDFEVGQKSVTQTVRMIVERKLSTAPSAAESARVIAAALGQEADHG